MPHSPSRTRPSRAAAHYQVRGDQYLAHKFDITMTLPNPQANQVVSLPVWVPGSYLVREFAKQLVSLRADQAGHQLALKQLDKSSWQLTCTEGTAVQLHYTVHAHDNSVRTAWLDQHRGFFNGTSLLLLAQGCRELPHSIELLSTGLPASWQVATGLQPQRTNAKGWGTYGAADYDELVDCPIEMGNFWSGDFVTAGVPHRLVVAGATAAFDGPRLLRETQTICAAHMRFWHGPQAGKTAKHRPPHARYVFMLNAVADGYGGLEHRNSTALIAKREDLPRKGVARMSDGHATLLGLISHEYFHTWNVKRLRPSEFAKVDYARENTTELLWFFEGFTSYYDDLLLRRCGLLDTPHYLKLLNKTLNQVLQTPGRKVHSLAQASFEAWTKYYRPDANTPNLTVSYYTKGALVALCLDLSLRASGHSLDALMRLLWQHCAGGPMAETDLLACLQQLTGKSWRNTLNAWVHSTQELPLQSLLQANGVGVQLDASPWAQRLGLRVKEDQGLHIQMVLSGGAAEKAGFSPGDEWLGIEMAKASKAAPHGWRLRRLDDLSLYAGQARQMVALVSRDSQLLRLQLSLLAADDPRVTTWRLSVTDAALVDQWLAG